MIHVVGIRRYHFGDLQRAVPFPPQTNGIVVLLFEPSGAVVECAQKPGTLRFRDRVRAHLAADSEIAPLLDRVHFEIAQTYLDKEPLQ